ncbi:hypothetical protein BH23ACT5_BH23ACT5_22760 [soil metagenome]
MTQLRTLCGALILALVVGACGDADVADTTTPDTSPPMTLPSTTATSTRPTIETTTTTDTDTDTDLPGEHFDLGPQAGDELGVVGVDSDDVLNLRAGPGTDNEIVATLDPVATGLIATGQNRLLSESIWNEVDVDEGRGWISSLYVGYIGMTDDATAQIIDEMGERPSAETMLDLGALVAEHVAGDDEQVRISVTVAPSVGDLGEVTYDVVGFADDSVLGVRLHVFGEPGDESFELRAIEQTVLCRRGVTIDGPCV